MDESKGLSRRKVTVDSKAWDLWWDRLQKLMDDETRFAVVWDKARRRVRNMN